MRVKHLDDLGEVRGRPSQAVDLIDDDGVDPMRGDVGEKTLERGALHGPAGIAGVVIELRQGAPALVPLALDVGFARLALGVEGVELLFEPFFRGLAGVDGAAQWRRPSIRSFQRSSATASHMSPSHCSTRPMDGKAAQKKGREVTQAMRMLTKPQRRLGDAVGESRDDGVWRQS